MNSKVYYNNGLQNKMFEPGTQPDGWVPGRISKPRGSYNKPPKKWYNNYIEQAKFEEGKQPEGWVLGQLKTDLHWYNNGITQRKFKVTEVPEGWEKGPLKSTSEKISKQHLTEEYKDKYFSTLIEKYGSLENYYEQSSKKGLQSKIDNFGSWENYVTEQVAKSKQTKLERYGDENYINTEKIAQTKSERYGSSTYNNREKCKETVLARYGVEYNFQAEEVKNKSKQTKLERYGNPYYNTEKAKEAIQEKYGVDNVFKLDNIKEKIAATNLEKYGAENPFGSDLIKEKIRQHHLSKYGVPFASQSAEVKEKIHQTCIEKYGVDYFCMTTDCRNASSNNSKPNIEFAALLDSYNLNYEREFRLENRSYDFKVGNYLIEINPTATHNSTWSPFNKQPIDKDYHIEKSLLAEKYGYKCIHIFDWDDKNKIINLLLPRLTVYARQCQVKLINDKFIEQEYLNLFHLQGYVKSDISLGLYYEDKLVSLMTFGKPRYNKNYEYELLRYCSSFNVIGGANKLFKYFIRNYSPISIISYCDNAKFKGNVYKDLGFEKISTKVIPSKHWYNIKTKQHITDNLLRQLGYDKLFNTNYGVGTSNEELMLTNGFVEIYDAGQYTYSLLMDDK